MSDKNEIGSRLRALGGELRGQGSVVDDVMSRVKDMPVPMSSRPEQRDAVIWRFIMKRYGRIAAVAAVLVIAVVIGVKMIDKVTPAAYALQQTIAAIREVGFVHVMEWSAGQDEPLSIWIEYNENTEPLTIRMSLPAWKSPEDGAKEVLWQDNVAQVYVPKKNVLLTVAEKRLREFRKLASSLDAGELFKKMATLENIGQRKVEVTMPTGDQDKIVIASTGNGLTKKFYVDPGTRLLARMETYRVDADNNETLEATMDFDYVRPEADVFAIQVPEGTTEIDMVNTIIGIPQGEMTDEQAAKETVRQFWQALIEQDYQKAGAIFSGVPADKMQEIFGKFKVIRVVSTDEPIVDAVSKTTGGYRVKCVLQIEMNGRTTQQEFGLLVRKGGSEMLPDNWMIY